MQASRNSRQHDKVKTRWGSSEACDGTRCSHCRHLLPRRTTHRPIGSVLCPLLQAQVGCSLVRVTGRTSKRFSRQGLQKWCPQGVDSGSRSSILQSVQVNSRRARSCSEACATQQ